MQRGRGGSEGARGRSEGEEKRGERESAVEKKKKKKKKKKKEKQGRELVSRLQEAVTDRVGAFLCTGAMQRDLSGCQWWILL